MNQLIFLIIGILFVGIFLVSINDVFAQEGIEDRIEELENKIEETKLSLDFTAGVQIALVAITSVLVLVTIINMHKTRKLVEKQLITQERQTNAQERGVDLSEKELEQKYLANLIITDVDFKFHAKQHEQNMFKINFNFKIRNDGNEEARNIKAYAEVLETERTIEDIASKENRIEKIEIQTQGSLIKNDLHDCGIVWEIKDFTKGFVNIWITYAYSRKEFDEIVYMYTISGGQTYKKVGVFPHERLVEIEKKGSTC